MKTLIFVWTQKFCNLNLKPPQGTFGIGDILRGSIGALRYCEERGYECIIDISLHPLSQMLVVKPHRFSQLIQENKDNIKYISQYSTIKDIDAEFEGKDLIYFFSNFNLDVLDTPASISIKERIRDILTPNEYLESYLTTLKSSIPTNFSVLHFRLGDDSLVLGKDTELQGYINCIKSVSNPSIVLMTDSVKLKELTKDIIVSLEGSPVHVGYATSHELKHTMAEFMMLRDAQCIFTHSIYFWISGFVKLINYIYDVQLIKL